MSWAGLQQGLNLEFCRMHRTVVIHYRGEFRGITRIARAEIIAVRSIPVKPFFTGSSPKVLSCRPLRDRMRSPAAGRDAHQGRFRVTLGALATTVPREPRF